MNALRPGSVPYRSERARPGGRQTRLGTPNLKGLLLFALALPLLPASIIALGAGRFTDLLADGSAFALYMLGAWFARRGLLSAGAVPRSRYAPGPWVSLKNLGAGLVAAATGVAAFFGVGHGAAISLAFASLALVGFHLRYGLEPMGWRHRRYPMGGEHDEVLTRVLAEAERRILSIERASDAIGNQELRARLGNISAQGRDLFEMIERRPRDLRRARRFLTVYLEGVERVIRGYAQTHRLADSKELEQNFRNVLVTIEDVFAEQRKRLLETDVMDLDVQIEVLAKQLKREGIL